MSEFKIEVGKSYRTLYGQPAVVDEYIVGHEYPFRGHVYGKCQSWTEGGTVFLYGTFSHDDDLIASWEETAEELCAADVSNAFNAQATTMRTPINPSGVSSDIGDLIKTRSETHGSFDTNSHVSQAIKSTLREWDGWERLSVRQREALDHICGKLGRIMAGDPDHADHWIDIAGYAQLAAMGGEE